MIEEKIKETLPDAEVFVDTKDNIHFHVTVIDDYFADLSRIRRHRKIMELFKDELISSEIHALSLKVFTRSEWASLEE